MAEGGIETFSETRNKARVAQGFKGGPFLMNPNLAPAMTIEPGWPATVLEKLDAGMIPQSKPIDGWVERRPNATLK